MKYLRVDTHPHDDFHTWITIAADYIAVIDDRYSVCYITLRNGKRYELLCEQEVLYEFLKNDEKEISLEGRFITW